MIPGPTELILILLIVVVIFGAKRIPEIMGGIGKGIKSFKKAMDGEENAGPATSLPPAQSAAPPASAQNTSPQDTTVAQEKTEQK